MFKYPKHFLCLAELPHPAAIWYKEFSVLVFGGCFLTATSRQFSSFLISGINKVYYYLKIRHQGNYFFLVKFTTKKACGKRRMS